MRSFLCKGKTPICKWGSIPSGIMYEGSVPEGYSLAISPGDDYIVVDVDRHGNKDGFEYLSDAIYNELEASFNYKTKNNGKHYWLRYSGTMKLANRASGIGIDLRVGDKGYVVYYGKDDIRDKLDLINISSEPMNRWLESLFYYKNTVKWE